MITLSNKCETLTGNPVPLQEVCPSLELLLTTFLQLFDKIYDLNFKPNQSIGRQWTDQTCVEYGFFQSSDLTGQPFGPYFPVDFFVQQCADIFVPQFDLQLLQKSVQFTNNFYGGYGLKVRKVLFPNGSIDPWHALGVTKDLSPDSKALYINGTAHCADMYPQSDKDPKQLTDARNTIIKTLEEFLTKQ